MNEKHAPIPWTYEATASSAAQLGPQYAIYEENDHTGRDVAIVYASDAGEANAAFIVRACNNFEDLLHLMQAFSEQVFASDSLSVVRPWAARFREAIAKAEEA